MLRESLKEGSEAGMCKEELWQAKGGVPALSAFGAKKSVLLFIGKDEYKFGDVTRTIVRKFRKH